MKMQMENRLSCVGSAIGDDAEVGQALLLRDFVTDLEAMPQKRSIFFLRTSYIYDLFLGDHEKVDGSDGIDVPKSEGLFVLINDVSRNFAADYFSEDRAHKTLSYWVEMVLKSLARTWRLR